MEGRRYIIPKRINVRKGNKEAVGKYQSKVTRFLTNGDFEVSRCAARLCQADELESSVFPKELAQQCLEVFTTATTTIAREAFTDPPKPVMKWDRRGRVSFKKGSEGHLLVSHLRWVRRAMRATKNWLDKTDRSRHTALRLLTNNSGPTELIWGTRGPNTDMESWLTQCRATKSRLSKQLKGLPESMRKTSMEEASKRTRRNKACNNRAFRQECLPWKKKQIPLLTVFAKDATVLGKGEEVISRTAEYLTDLYNNPEPQEELPRPWIFLDIWDHYKYQIRRSYEIGGKLTRPVDLEEWEEWLKRKRSTAPGLDGIQYNALQVLPKDGTTLIINLINWMLVNLEVLDQLKEAEMIFLWKGKKDIRDLTDHRVLSLLKIPYKCVMGILAARKGRIRDSLPCFATGQGGGIAGRTIGDKATIVESAIKWSIRRSQPTAFIWFDLVKGYDLVTRKAIKDSVRCIGWGEEYERIKMSALSNFRAIARTPYGHSSSIDYANGLKQGDPEAPDSYDDFMEMLYRWHEYLGYELTMTLDSRVPDSPIFGREIKIGHQGWIDDLGAIVPLGLAQDVVDSVVYFANSYGSKVSEKTIAMYTGVADDVVVAPLTMGQIVIPWTQKKFRVLGYLFNYMGNWQDHLEYLEAKIREKLARILLANTDLDGRTNLINSDVLGLLLYSADLVPFKKQFARVLAGNISIDLVTQAKGDRRGIGNVAKLAAARLLGGLKKRLGGLDRTAVACSYFDIWEAQHLVCNGVDPFRNPGIATNKCSWKLYPDWILSSRAQLGLETDTRVANRLKAADPGVVNQYTVRDAIRCLAKSNPLDCDKVEQLPYQSVKGIGKVGEQQINNYNQQLLDAVMGDPIVLGVKYSNTLEYFLKNCSEFVGMCTSTEVATDGSYRPNAGNCWTTGAVTDGEDDITFKLWDNNNINCAEAVAVIIALLWVDRSVGVTVYSDSLATVTLFNKSRRDKWTSSRYRKSFLPEIVECFLWICEHRSGAVNLLNRRADEGASRAHANPLINLRSFWRGINPLGTGEPERRAVSLVVKKVVVTGSWYDWYMKSRQEDTWEVGKVNSTVEHLRTRVFDHETSWGPKKVKISRLKDYMFMLKVWSRTLPTLRCMVIRHPELYDNDTCIRCGAARENFEHALVECSSNSVANDTLRAKVAELIGSDKLYWPGVFGPPHSLRGINVGFITGGIPLWVREFMDAKEPRTAKKILCKVSKIILGTRRKIWKARCTVMEDKGIATWAQRRDEYLQWVGDQMCEVQAMKVNNDWWDKAYEQDMIGSFSLK